MTLRVDNDALARGHEAFLRFMHDNPRSNGIPFTSFSHRFFYDFELAYKSTVYWQARDVLQLERWSRWKKTPGHILKAVREACSSKVSANLLQHRYGLTNSSEAPLYRVRREAEIRGLEEQLHGFFTGGHAPAEFGPRFDVFASYLREHRLGCRWPFPAYLAFIVSPQNYFPVRPARLDLLLSFYGTGEKIAGSVSWERYSILLELADLLKDRLAAYGPATALELQSYMWVVAYLVEKNRVPAKRSAAPVDLEAEFQRRVQAAKERERIGLAGERLVFEQEKKRLHRIGRRDLAAKVRLVSADGSEVGFDVISFEPRGGEIHIEVKTTTASRENDPGFWLSEVERRLAGKDAYWTVYRVSSIDSSPHVEQLGNVVTLDDGGWELNPSTWFVTRTAVQPLQGFPGPEEDDPREHARERVELSDSLQGDEARVGHRPLGQMPGSSRSSSAG